jgi:hypothetical protein
MIGANYPGMGLLGSDAACAFNFIDRRAVWEDTLALGDEQVITYRSSHTTYSTTAS